MEILRCMKYCVIYLKYEYTLICLEYICSVLDPGKGTLVNYYKLFNAIS